MENVFIELLYLHRKELTLQAETNGQLTHGCIVRLAG